MKGIFKQFANMFCKIICFSNIDLEPRFTGCPLGGPACLSPLRPPGGRRLQQNGLLLVRNSNRFCSLSPARFALAALSRHLGHWESWIKKSISLVSASTSVICSAGTGCEPDLLGGIGGRWCCPVWTVLATSVTDVIGVHCETRPSRRPVMCHCFR